MLNGGLSNSAPRQATPASFGGLNHNGLLGLVFAVFHQPPPKLAIYRRPTHMARKRKVWLVDDLPENLERFRSNHESHFDIETFSNTGEVLSRINNKEYPDALLCDVFFYDTEEARNVEKKIEGLAAQLKQTATEIGANDHTRAVGILLMKNIYDHFGEKRPKFPMYAYTSKGPFLLEQSEWENISKYGAEVLLKNRITPEREWTEIEGDIAISKREHSLGTKTYRIARVILFTLPGLFYLLVGRYLRGSW
jgi:CheY-like chemotaxis protein